MLDLLIRPTNNKSLNSIVWKILDAVYPPSCCHCGIIGFEICPQCFENIKIIPLAHVCRICGSPRNKNRDCLNIGSHSSNTFQEARSWGLYQGPLKSALQKIKYQRGFGLIRHFTESVANHIRLWGLDFDFFVPVALGAKRLMERGYNQSECIAQPVAEILNKAVVTSALLRTRETQSQVGLDKNQRIENVSGAFSARRDLCEDKSILLFDDITTTFSTLNACSAALLSAGAKSVACFTVARTIFQQEKEKK
jgi:ComF family protein